MCQTNMNAGRKIEDMQLACQKSKERRILHATKDAAASIIMYNYDVLVPWAVLVVAAAPTRSVQRGCLQGHTLGSHLRTKHRDSYHPHFSYCLIPSHTGLEFPVTSIGVNTIIIILPACES